MNWTSRLRAAFDRSGITVDDDVIEELAQHAAAMYAAARADGSSAEEAERLVGEQLATWTSEAARLRRRVRRSAAIEPPAANATSPCAGLVQDIRYAARIVRRHQRHALLAATTMALGIGATTLLFSVTYGVLVRPLAWPNADRVVALRETRGGVPPRFGTFTNAAYLAWRDDATTVDALAAWSLRLVTLSGSGEPQRIPITAATASLFPVLGARPLIGALFDPQDEIGRVVVLGEGLWRRHFGANPAVLGTSVHLDGDRYTVIGVLPHLHAYPDARSAAVVPYAVPPTTGNNLAMFNALALLRPGATPAQASAEATGRGHAVANTDLTTVAIFGNNGPLHVTAQPLREAITGEVRRPLVVLLVAVALLLAAATANVASVQLARSTTRHREMAIRRALGAGGGRLARQLVLENLLVGTAGGALGLAGAWLLHRSLGSLMPADFPRIAELRVDAPVALFAFIVSVTTSAVCALVPALSLRRLSLTGALGGDGGKLADAGAHRRAGGREVIMAAQVAIACVLLVGASLLVRSFLALLSADRGYNPAGVLSARLSMPGTMYPAERRFALVDRVLERLAAAPEVMHAAFTSDVPLSPGGSTAAFALRSPHADGGVISVQASPRLVSPRYFAALGSRVVMGRVFAESDTGASEPVAVVNEAFARRYLGPAPLGRKLPLTGFGEPARERAAWTVVGVVENVRYVTETEVSRPEVYYSYRQMQGELPVQTVTLLARTWGDPEAAAGAVRTAIREADERLAAEALMPLDARLLATLARPRLYAALLGAFAALAVVMAGVGLFGVLSYSVSQRSRELAIRSALGAHRNDIVRLVLRRGLAVTGAGLAAGIAVALGTTRLLSTQLYGVTPYDALTFSTVPLVILACGLAACVTPALRAARLDPVRVLRDES